MFAKETGNEWILERFGNFIEVSETEKAASDYVDKTLERRGIKVTWAYWTFYLTALFFMSTMFVAFYKADFMNLSVCTLAFLFLDRVD